MHKLLHFILYRCGKTYTPDPHLPFSFIIGLFGQKLIWLLRGWFRLQRPIFVGPSVILEGRQNMIVGRNCTFDPYTRINAIARTRVTFGQSVRIGAFSRILCTAHLSKVGNGFAIGDQSSCGEFCFFGAAGGITIGRHVIMGQYVSMHAQDHIYSDTTIPIQHQPTTEKGITIGDNCWIGAKVTILDGTQIGRGCVIAAGAVVKGTFPDNAVIGGVPAKILKMRHD